jgi:Tol biopolymer transport system component
LIAGRLAIAQSTELISVSINGGPGNHASFVPDISPDGRFVAFLSNATDLVLEKDDLDYGPRAYFLDRQTGVMELIDTDSGGIAVSADGHYVAFSSLAPRVPEDSNNEVDAFVLDRQTGAIVRVSVSSSGKQGFDPKWPFSAWLDVAISDDGRLVVFASSLQGLVEHAFGSDNAVYLHDRDSDEDGVFDEQDEPGSIETVCMSCVIPVVTLQHFGVVSLPNNGQSVGFVEWGSDYQSGTPYAIDRLDGTPHLLSVATDGSTAPASWPRGSGADGRFWVFSSDATNLVVSDTNGFSDVFVRDIKEQTTRRLSIGFDWTEANGHSYFPSISDDGRFVSFTSLASNLVPNDLNETPDIFVHDRDADANGVFDEPGGVVTHLVSVNSEGQQQTAMGPACISDGWCIWNQTAVSADGRTIAFVSQPGELVESTGGVATGADPEVNVFVHVRNEPAACPGDLDDTTSIDAADLQSMLADWGTCFGCEAELDGDNIVGPGDLAALLASWGQCS